MTADNMSRIDGKLHDKLVSVLPQFVKEPFSESPRLNVPALHKALGTSHETVYKWLRADKLHPKNVEKIVALAHTNGNVVILTKLNRQPPIVQDFHSFVFAS